MILFSCFLFFSVTTLARPSRQLLLSSKTPLERIASPTTVIYTPLIDERKATTSTQQPVSSTYRVYPTQPSDLTANTNILQEVLSIRGVKNDSVVVYGPLDPKEGTLLWVLPLDDDGKKYVTRIPGVARVELACHELAEGCSSHFEDFGLRRDPVFDHSSSILDQRYLARRAVTLERNAVDEMTFLSSFPFPKTSKCFQNFRLKDYGNNFAYDGTAGRGVTIYVLGEINAQIHLHKEFQDIRNHNSPRSVLGNPDRISWAGPEYSHLLNQKYPNPKSPDSYTAEESEHGTAVLSKLVGQRYGAAKDVTVVMVRRSHQPNPQISRIDELSIMLMWIREDWKRRRTQDRAGDLGLGVINISGGLLCSARLTASERNQLINLRNGLNNATKDGLFLVAAAGNDGLESRAAVAAYPQIWAKPSRQQQGVPGSITAPVPTLLLVGGVDNNGKLWDSSRAADFVQQYAPAVHLNLAYPDGSDIVASGTSFAAPMVAGIVAYYIGLLATFPNHLKQSITQDWPRTQQIRMLYRVMTSTSKWRRNYLDDDPSYPGAIWNAANMHHVCPQDIDGV